MAALQSVPATSPPLPLAAAPIGAPGGMTALTFVRNAKGFRAFELIFKAKIGANMRATLEYCTCSWATRAQPLRRR